MSFVLILWLFEILIIQFKPAAPELPVQSDPIQQWSWNFRFRHLSMKLAYGKNFKVFPDMDLDILAGMTHNWNAIFEN